MRKLRQEAYDGPQAYSVSHAPDFLCGCRGRWTVSTNYLNSFQNKVAINITNSSLLQPPRGPQLQPAEYAPATPTHVPSIHPFTRHSHLCTTSAIIVPILQIRRPTPGEAKSSARSLTAGKRRPEKRPGDQHSCLNRAAPGWWLPRTSSKLPPRNPDLNVNLPI